MGTNVKMELEAASKFVFNVEEKCTEGVFEGPTSTAGDRPFRGEFGSMFFAGCTQGLNECSAPVLGEPYVFSLWRSVRQGKGTLTMPLTVELECGGLACKYSPTLVWTPIAIIGGDMPGAKATSPPIPLAKVGGDAGCDEDALWEGDGGGEIKFKFEEPTPLWITT
jgi:hypothetical protein